MCQASFFFKWITQTQYLNHIMIGQIKSKKLVCSAQSSTPSIIIKYWIIFDKSVCLGYIDGLMGGTGRGNALKQIGLSILWVILWLLFKWYWSKVPLFIKQLFKMFYLYEKLFVSGSIRKWKYWVEYWVLRVISILAAWLAWILWKVLNHCQVSDSCSCTPVSSHCTQWGSDTPR